MTAERIKNIVEAALLAAVQPLSVDNLMELFVEDEERPERSAVRDALSALQDEWRERGVELVEVSSGFRFQVRRELSPWVGRLWAERPARYSRALLETLALIAYRQPITRGEIEDVRGVTLSSSIMKTLLEREWIRVLGHRDVPGRPALYGTTRAFLDHFNLKSLDHLPPLEEIRDLDAMPDLFAQAGGEAETRAETGTPAQAAAPHEALHDEAPQAQPDAPAASAAQTPAADDAPEAEASRPPPSEDAAPESASGEALRSEAHADREAENTAEDDDTEAEAQSANAGAH